MTTPLSKPSPARRSLKRLVMRLAYCAAWDAKWYVRTGFMERLDDVCYCFARLAYYALCAPVSVLVLIARPLVSPLHWVWHATVNAERIEAMMAKTHNEKVSDGGETK